MTEGEENRREKEAMAMNLWRADLADEMGANYVTTLRVFTGEFREYGVLVPTDDLGFAHIPSYFMDGVIGHSEEGFVIQQLFYSAQVDRYAVVETVWEEEISPPGFPIGKPPPEGTAPLRWVTEDDDAPKGAMVVWDSDDVPCPKRSRAFPADRCMVPTDWVSEEQVRAEFPHLWRE